MNTFSHTYSHTYSWLSLLEYWAVDHHTKLSTKPCPNLLNCDHILPSASQMGFKSCPLISITGAQHNDTDAKTWEACWNDKQHHNRFTRLVCRRQPRASSDKYRQANKIKREAANSILTNCILENGIDCISYWIRKKNTGKDDTAAKASGGDEDDILYE